jgi:hypothetical protein
VIALDSAIKGEIGPGLVGFLVVAALGFALFLLVKSMRRHVAKIEVPSEAELRKQGDTTPTPTSPSP